MIRTASDATFHSAVMNATVPVLVEVGATWCPPCRALAPVLDAVATDRRGSIEVVTVDADESPGVVASLGIMSVPTLLLYQDGTTLGRWVGYRSKPALLGLLDAALGGSRHFLSMTATRPAAVGRVALQGGAGTRRIGT